MATPCIDLLEHVGLGLIVSWPSGIYFTNQTGGTACLHPEYEGVFVPLQNRAATDGYLLSPERDLLDYFCGPRWRGTGATDGMETQDADFIDRLLQESNLFPTIAVNRRRLADCHEAWIHVAISGEEPCDFPVFSGFAPYPRPGILTWSNSD